MKSALSILALLLVLPVAAAMAMDMPAAPSNPAFERMKGLVGEWRSTMPDGKTSRTTFEVVSGGSALIERQAEPNGSEMLTLYHCDGPRLLMTHFCSLGNQPRMRARVAAADPKAIQFEFVDITNMAAKNAPHMHALVVNFDDPDHVVEQWTLREQGKDQVMPIKLERKK